MSTLKYKPRYSGPNCSGICVCRHPWDEHHLGVVLNQEYYEATKEGNVPQECEHYGFNEMGGLDAKGRPHCGNYRDRGIKKRKQTKTKRTKTNTPR